MMLNSRPPFAARGFSLVELIMVLVIAGVLAGGVALFIKNPLDGYFAAARRAEMTDVADTAVRRLARDVHLALPNSVRNPVDGSALCVEYIPTKIGGRYRMASGAAGDDILDFTAVDDQFDMLWLNSALPANNRIAAGDVVAVYNDGSGKADCTGSFATGDAGGNAYCGYNAIQVAGVVENAIPQTSTISFVDAVTASPFNRKQLPSESPSYRFQVIPANEHVVAYACSGGALYRYSRKLTGVRTQPADCAAMTTGATAAKLADNVNMATCSLKYEPPGSGTGLSRFGMLSISLQITVGDESVSLYHQIHVDNTP